ncbi:MAG: flagellar FliJ family protein [candidate division Zixibacteria bacterium]|nr:flagellar FliJ family protein [candidate division Zixibacteria bacterium]
MKKFRFRLEKLLQLKVHVEKDKQKLLGIAARKVTEQETFLLELKATRLTTQKAARSCLTGTLNPNLLLGYSRYFIKLKKNELAGREILKAYLTEREKKRLELVEATKQKKIYEKLKERKLQLYHKEIDSLLQKELDESSSQMLLYRERLQSVPQSISRIAPVS